MSVLIKGMEMPTSCESCPCKTLEAFGGLGCQATGYIPLRKANQDRPDGCPLIEIPPHGRLIDADVLFEKIKGIWDCNDMVFRTNDKICNVPEDCKGCKWSQTKDCIQRMVEDAPTIIPAGRYEE